MSPFAYDIIILAILLLSVYMGYRRGFILTLCGFLAVFVGIIGATIISNVLAEPVTNIVRPVIENNLQDYLSNVSPEVAAGAELSLPAALDFLRDSALYRGFVSTLENLMGSQAAATTAAVIAAIAEHISLQLTRTILFVFSFIIVLIGWKILSHVLNLAFRLPILSSLNRLAGAGVGLLKGSVLLFILIWLFKDSLFTPEMIEASYLLQFFSTINPLHLF